MLEHHIQRAIVYRLALAPSLRFSELQPDDIENKLFTYHLKKVMSAGLVAKNEVGEYTLTAEGRRLGLRALDKQADFLNEPDSVLFLVVRRASDNAWLLYRRRVHPLRGGVGFMHAKPSLNEPSEQVAANVLRAQTGLDGTFRALGGGMFRVLTTGSEPESFTHFVLLVCEDAAGELHVADQLADYFWESTPDFTAANMLPNMTVLVELYQAGQPFYIEQTLQTKLGGQV